ncbi:MAG: class I SAM-dependent methyltransferase [Cyclobacteriaceae bacterium]|nr:class I SAM-dependent methyltransferase [Cyclobacteriaceae bacterium]
MSKDLFSGHAKNYAAFRPEYPQTLYDFIYQFVEQFDNAWDCGTGNGQVARVLAKSFKQVKASDISSRQIENASTAANIEYHLSGVEQTDFASDSFDLITVGQAIHWFDREKFYTEVSRVGKLGAIIAAFGYNPVRFSPPFDEALNRFYFDVIYPYWDTERKVVEDQYQSISFPFEEIDAPDFRTNLEWSIKDLHGYITTWSAVQHFIKQNGFNPVDEFVEGIRPLWKKETESVYFPVFLRLGRINK